MGMAASQARFLNLTARKSNIEYEGQQINQQRTTLSNQSADLYNQMLTLQVPTPPSTQDYTKAYIYNDTSHTYDANVHLLFNGDITDTLYINDDTLICNDYPNQSQHGIIRYFDSPICIKKIVYYPYSKDILIF